MTESPPEPVQILPLAVRRPAALLLTHVLPLLILVAANGFFFWILQSEMDAEQKGRWTSLLILGCVLTVLSLGLFQASRRRTEVHPGAAAGMLALLILYLVPVTVWFQTMIPEAEALWILQPERWMGLQYTFCMPALFHNLLRVACLPTRLPRMKDLMISGAAAIGLPLLAYLGMHLTQSFSFFGEGMLIFLAGFTLISMIFILRAITTAYLAASRRPEGRIAAILLIGLAAPLGGLWLNREIPFPADYQHPAVYLLTVLNALVLLLPVDRGPRCLRWAVWGLLWAMLPFTIYFFLVFLPWLPASLVAILAMGAGFLILAPTGLMLLHALRIRQAARDLKPLFSRHLLIITAALGIAVLPAAFLVRAWSHRTVIHQAIAFVFEPDLSDPTPFQGNRNALKTVLVNLQEHYEGRYVPYLTDLYDALVFNGMILPASNMDRIHQTFFGTPMPEPPETDRAWFSSRRGRRSFRRALGTPPPVDAVLEEVEWTMTQDETLVTWEATLTLHNPTSREVEFAETIELPPGVWVTDYWLKVNGERKRGQLREKGRKGSVE